MTSDASIDKTRRQLRSLESAEERTVRLEREAQERRDDIAADDRAVHEMIKRNLDLYGP